MSVGQAILGTGSCGSGIRVTDKGEASIVIVSRYPNAGPRRVPRSHVGVSTSLILDAPTRAAKAAPEVATGAGPVCEYRELAMAPVRRSATAPRVPAIEQALALFAPAHRPPVPQLEAGYLDLLGEQDPTGAHPGQQLMLSSTLALIYERLWRPLGGRLLMGATGHRIGDEHRMALNMLKLSRNDRVLDVACGPGNFTRGFARAAGEGLVVGLDASQTMLAVAVRKTESANLAYVRGDACALPFRDGSFDAICCFAALYLIQEPMRALDEIARVLAPGGRVALLSSCNRGPLPARVTNPVVQTLTGVRIFARDELTRALRDRGLTSIEQHVVGLAQFVSARKLATSP
jgi:ubiquinone/menaquinone biosynthesis C-methylase UbiE